MLSKKINTIFVHIKETTIPMKSREEYINLIKGNASELKSKFGIKSLCIFGSVSRNEQKEGSDIDVFVDMEPKILLLSGLKLYLENLTKASVDVVRKHKHMNPLLIDEIKRDGISVI